MRKIPLVNGGHAVVDNEDYEFLSQWKWRRHTKGYASRIGGGDLMHRIILNAPKGIQVDHIDGDKLNNSRSNTRLCTNGQNHMNIKKYKNKTSKYKGVHWRKDKKIWCAELKFNKKKIRLGYFSCEKKAALAYNDAAMEFFKEFALLNVLEEAA